MGPLVGNLLSTCGDFKGRGGISIPVPNRSCPASQTREDRCSARTTRATHWGVLGCGAGLVWGLGEFFFGGTWNRQTYDVFCFHVIDTGHPWITVNQFHVSLHWVFVIHSFICLHFIHCEHSGVDYLVCNRVLQVLVVWVPCHVPIFQSTNGQSRFTPKQIKCMETYGNTHANIILYNSMETQNRIKEPWKTNHWHMENAMEILWKSMMLWGCKTKHVKYKIPPCNVRLIMLRKS